MFSKLNENIESVANNEDANVNKRSQARVRLQMIRLEFYAMRLTFDYFENKQNDLLY